MKRREFVWLVGGAVAWPITVRAQQPSAPVIGYLDGSNQPQWFKAFETGLNELGYVQGQNISIERRSAVGQVSRLPDLATELIHLQPKVIVTSGSSAVVVAKNATATIPIIFTYATDPVGLGLVASLSRPGGNITGQSNQAAGLVGKRLQHLAEMLPGVSRFGVVWSPSFSANHFDFREMQAAALALGVGLVSIEVTRPEDFEATFKKAAIDTGGVAVLSGPLIFSHRERIVAAAAQHKVPAIYYDAAYAELGGLLSYGPDLLRLHHSAAVFVDKILKGAKPADLPVEQPTRFKLVVNMKAAKALGLTVPPTLLVRADEVIE